jgi:hypothetical protein
MSIRNFFMEYKKIVLISPHEMFAKTTEIV